LVTKLHIREKVGEEKEEAVVAAAAAAVEGGAAEGMVSSRLRNRQ
jgi:phosphoribosyl-ATP pyrophosphohydrolase